MFTSDRSRGTEDLTVVTDRYENTEGSPGCDNGGHEIHNALIYLLTALFLAAAGAVYEHFSFGVYSNYMIYAFAIPLIGGTLPQMLIGLRRQRRAAAADGLVGSEISDGAGTGISEGDGAISEGNGAISEGNGHVPSLNRESGMYCGAEVCAEGFSKGGAEVRANGFSKGFLEGCDAENIPVNPDREKANGRERFLQEAEALVRSRLYSAALATLTVGSIMKGVLDICGRPNGLTIGYPIAAALLLAAALLRTFRNKTGTGERPLPEYAEFNK